MKIKSGYMLREVAGNYVAVAIGQEAVNFNGLIRTNETGAFLWKLLENDVTEEKLTSEMCKEYDVDKKTAASDVKAFIVQLSEANLIEK